MTADASLFTDSLKLWLKSGDGAKTLLSASDGLALIARIEEIDAENGDLKAKLAKARSDISDEQHREERLERIAKLCLTDIRAHSRDVDDYLETLEYIAAIARGLKGPT